MNPFRAAILAVAAVVLVLSACGELDDGYKWTRAGPPAQAVTWNWLDRCRAARDADCARAVNNLCPQINAKGDVVFVPELWGCVWYSFTGAGCSVWSIYSEAEAKTVKLNGRSHYEHEVGPAPLDATKPYGHCNGYVHAGQAHARVI